MSPELRELLEWLIEQPPSGRLGWSASGITSDHPWDIGWVDLQLHGAGQLELNWALTVEHTQAEEHPDPTVLRLDYDSELHMLMRDQDALGLPQGVQLWTPEQPPQILAVDPGVPWDFYQHPGLEDDPLPRARRDGRTIIHPVWSVPALSQAITEWVARMSGREDLRVQWLADAPEPEYVQRARERLQELGEWEEQAIDAGDGVFLHPEVFDQLAADPDSAGQLLGELKRRLGLIDPEA